MEEKNKDNQTIEDKFDELDELLNKMDDENLPLEESFELYNKGLELIKDCNNRIEKVENELTILDKGENE